MRSEALLPAWLFLGLCAGVSWCQDVASGPSRGDKVPALKVFDATGEHKDKEVDYSAERKDKVTVYAFVKADEWKRPMARFLKGLDGEVKKDFADAYVVAVWLTDEADKTKEYLPKAQTSLSLEKTALTCFPGEKTGPTGWGINADAHLTVVVAVGGKVAAVFGYNTVNETDIKAVREAVEKAARK